MADELIENAEYGRKRKDEEPPILVAQRFLNIYRQMHIFNRARQEEFDNMLLGTSPEVRILLSTLPGGGLLLEHIAEIEQKKGVVSSFPLKQVVTRKKDLTSNMQVSPENTEGYHQSGGGVVIDASFASELSSSLSAALQQTEKKHKEDLKTLTETITNSILESQTAMVSMMRDILVATKSPHSSFVTEKNNIIPATGQEAISYTKSPETNIPTALGKYNQPKAPEVKSSAPVQPVQPKAPEVKSSASVQPVQPKAPEVKSSAPAQPVQTKVTETSIYKNELDKIKSAIKNDIKVFDVPELASLDSLDSDPISLDDINDDFSFEIKTEDKKEDISTPLDIVNEDDEWEWEYVDDDSNSDEWEWEYVEDDTDSDDWEWEYVEDDTPKK